MAGVFIEPELKYRVGSVPGNVRHEGKLVGRVGLDGVCATGSMQAFDWWAAHHSIIPDGMYCHICTFIVGGEQKPSLSVCGQKEVPTKSV